MAESVLLKASGLYTFPNHLSSVPPGALIKASNVVINRDNIAESRRGFKLYGNTMGASSTLTAHQLLNYKNRLIRHYGAGAGTTLEYDSDGSGTFTAFSVIFNGDTHSNTVVDSIASTAELEVGMFVSGSGIAAGTIIASITNNTSLVLSITASTSLTATPLTYGWNIAEVTSGLRIKSVESNGNLYFTSSEGIRKISILNTSGYSSALITPAGGVKALDVRLTLNATPGFLTAQSVVAYRTLWGITDSNNNEILGTPSPRTVIRNTDASNTMTVDVKITIPQGITTAHFYQVYRTAVLSDPASTQDPGDEEQLVYESNPTNSDLSNGYVSITDVTPETFRAGGANLYTNQNSGEGILQANDVPPLAYDVTTFKGYTFYSNTATRQRLNLSLLSIAALVSGTSTLTITDGTTLNTYTFKTQTLSCHTHTSTTIDNIVSTATLLAGQSISGADITPGTFIVEIIDATSIKISQAATGSNTTTIVAGYESVSNKYIGLSQFATPGQQVDETALSLIHVINSNTSDIVYAYYLSGPADVPGLILLEGRKLNQLAFYLNVNDAATTGIEFNPALPISGSTVISTNEISPNRIYFSKFQQPEAVPIVNFIDVGPKDKAIVRILALRDNLFILKEDGVYRLSGLTTPFSVYPFDFSTNIKAPDSAVVLNNLIYLYSSQGIGTISDTGVSVISRPIEDDIQKFVLPTYTNFIPATFGVSYESDRSYYLFTVTNINDTIATQCFRFNTFTNSWTKLAIGKRSGLVNSFDDQLYLGATDINKIEQERKNFDRTDFSDRELSMTLGAQAISGTSVTLSSLTNVSVGDIIVQTQYLTIKKYNQLLSKLDRDSLLFPHDYVSTLTSVAGNNLSDNFDSLLSKLLADTGRTSVTGSVNGINQTVTITNATPGVFTNATNTTGYYNGMPILFTTNGTLPLGLTPSTIYFVSNLGTDGASKYRVSATSGGSAINTTSAGSGTHTAKPAYTALIASGAASFSALQTSFNLLIDILNNDLGVGYKNYMYSSGTTEYEFNILAVNSSLNTITAPYQYNLIQGPFIIYNHILVELQFVPQYFQDVSMTKHVSEGTLIFEDSSFSTATLSYSSDLSADFEEQDVSGNGNGIFGNNTFGEGLFGGNGSGIPFRTLLPKNKQRCRYINVKFKHNIGREIFSLYGLSLTYNPVSQRGWR